MVCEMEGAEEDQVEGDKAKEDLRVLWVKIDSKSTEVMFILEDFCIAEPIIVTIAPCFLDLDTPRREQSMKLLAIMAEEYMRHHDATATMKDNDVAGRSDTTYLEELLGQSLDHQTKFVRNKVGSKVEKTREFQKTESFYDAFYIPGERKTRQCRFTTSDHKLFERGIRREDRDSLVFAKEQLALSASLEVAPRNKDARDVDVDSIPHAGF